MNIVEALEKDQPQFHWGGTRRWNAAPETLREIQRSVKPGMRTLETGCGASTAVFAASGARHTVISPTHDEHERVIAYLHQKEIDTSNLSFEAGFSDDVLPRISNSSQRQEKWDSWCAHNFGADSWKRDTGDRRSNCGASRTSGASITSFWTALTRFRTPPLIFITPSEA